MFMANPVQSILIFCVLLMMPLTGCIGSSVDNSISEDETSFQIENPCLLPSQSISQSMTSISVNGVERMFRLSVPSSDVGTKLALIIAFHGGGGSEEDFQQQNQFDQLGEQQKFIMAYAIAESDRSSAEGEWYLNTAATSRDDNDFTEAIVDELSNSYCLDQDRLSHGEVCNSHSNM